jgi:anti-anti-sigma factor
MLIEIEHGDEVCVLRLSGHFRSGEDLGYVRDKSAEIRNHDCKKMLVDVRDLQSIGSMGVGFVAGVYIYLTKRSGGGHFMLAGANQRVREVLDITQLSTIIPLSADVPSGLAALRGESTAQRSTASSTSKT